MTDKEIQDLDDEELLTEYRETIEFRTIESEEGQISNRQIKLRKALEQEILSRMSVQFQSSKRNDVYEYIKQNPDCSYSEVLQSVGESGETIDALAELRELGDIYEPEKDCLRVTED